MVDIIAPADAFRLMLRTHYRKPGLKLPDKIKSYAWFWYPKRLHIPASVHATAEKVLKELCKYVKEGKIRLQSRSQIPPVDIDPIDCSLGVLDVFNQTLTIHAQSAAPDRTYRHVFCVKADVMKIVRNASNGDLTLKPASEKEIRDQIAAVYDGAAKAGNKPPNIVELPAAVQPRLKEAGYEASGRQIKRIGGEQQFRLRRLPAGQRA